MEMKRNEKNDAIYVASPTMVDFYSEVNKR